MHLCGLDLGQQKDYTALAVLQKCPPLERPLYVIRSLYRFPLLTPYPKMVQEIAHWTSQPPLAGGAMAVDATGVGAAVVDLFRAGGLSVSLFPIHITGGHQVTADEWGGHHVPKKDLVGVLQALLGSRRLVLAHPNLAHGRVLEKELRLFSAKITAAGNERLESWRERDHDDICLAVALSAWIGEFTAAGCGNRIRSDATEGRSQSLMSQLPANVFASEPRPRKDWRYFGGRAPDRGGRLFPY